MRLIFYPFFLIGVLSAAIVHANARDEIGGHIIATLDGETRLLPMLTSDIDVRIEGDMATVSIRQTFRNDALVPMQADYLFPLNQNAAVYGMEMVVGDEKISAVIREKAEAEARFEEAARDGKAAALLTQHRPNMFTQRIANLMPGLPVEVTLRYVQMVPKIEGQHELVIPLVVGPRYIGAPREDEVVLASDKGGAPVSGSGSWSLGPVPDHPPVFGIDLPDSFSAERVSLDLSLVSGLTLSDFGSATHPLEVETDEAGLTARFAEGRVLDNKDLVVRYTLGGAALEATSLAHQDERGGFLSLMVEPPALPDAAMIAPRELIFVIDTSGSMGGAPMAASRRFMDVALRDLRPGDYFRIIPFANAAQHFSPEATPATAQNIAAGRRFVAGLHTGGGTEIDTAIRAAFGTRQPDNTLRIVVFLSDGYIGDEAQVLRTINRQIGDARIYAFGVGNAVNRYLLDAMADEGRGYARYVPAGERASDVAETLAADLKTPLLTDITIDWGHLDVTSVVPARIPDLFAGQSLRVHARHGGTADTARIILRGRVQGRPAEMPVDLVLTGHEEPALPLIWARNRIAERSRDLAIGRDPQAANEEITRLGLEFSLQTRNTSFVAVSETRVNSTGTPASPANVALPIPADVPVAAFSGASTPEPQALFGLLIVALAALLGLRRRMV